MALTWQEVKDRAEISDVLHRYAQGIDQRAWDLYLSAFAEDAVIDVVGCLAAPMTPVQFKEFLTATFDRVRLSGQHLLANTLFLVSGNRAQTVTEFLAVNLERTEEPSRIRRQIAGGLYIDDLLRTAAGWKIVRRTLVRKSDDEEFIVYPETVLDAIEDTKRTSRFLAQH